MKAPFKLQIFNLTKNTIIASDVKMADTLCSRTVGLLNRKFINEEEALVISPCQSMHMFFMRFSIDVIFVDVNQCVVGIVENIRPFQLSPIFFKASYAIEIHSGGIKKSQTTMGDKVNLKAN